VSSETVSITLTVLHEDQHVERDLNALQEELRATPHLSVQRIITRNEPTPGAKGLFQDIALSVSTTIPALSVFATVIRAWLKTKQSRSIKLKIGDDSIELSGPWSDTQDRALDYFLARNAVTEAVGSNVGVAKSHRGHKKA
jgi:hypothetical protein